MQTPPVANSFSLLTLAHSPEPKGTKNGYELARFHRSVTCTFRLSMLRGIRYADLEGSLMLSEKGKMTR